MHQKHLQRLTALDASFLSQEREASHMHIGGLLVFEGKPPSIETMRKHVASRLHLIPRYRQKVATPKLEAGRPFWIDDPRFNIEYHVRDAALPIPGKADQLQLLAARIFSERLDRAKPLWELWIITGLENGGFALISKTHHCMVDGVSGLDLLTVLLDLEAAPSSAIPAAEEAWEPGPEPSHGELIARGIKGLAALPINIVEGAVRALENPGTSIGKAREAVSAVSEVLRETLDPAPVTPLNTGIGPHRRYRYTKASLADFKEVKQTLGGTVNDVVLTVVADALGRWLRSRGVSTHGLELRALVPVSIRAQDAGGEAGNQIAAMRGPLPVGEIDPVSRFTRVRAAMAGIKESKQALGAEVIANVQNFAPPTVLAQASRINFSTRLFNLLVTNVPGPQFPLYLMGREAVEVAPIAFLAERHTLAIAIVSYQGDLMFGLLGDYDAMPDLDVIAGGIDDAIDELLLVARAEKQRQLRPKARARAKKRRAAATV